MHGSNRVGDTRWNERFASQPRAYPTPRYSYQFTYKEEAEQAPGAVAGDVVVQAKEHA